MKHVPRISEAEWEVLTVLWRKAPLTASQVFAELGERAWKLNTVRTFLARLEKKGVIAAKDSAAGKVFSPRISRESCVHEASQTFLDRVFEGATASLLVHFVKSKRLSESELAELQSILVQKRNRK
ncbi:MAG: BlaI/MecI/CopY family transcriptional regulator [Verrucomicrobiota bacterium]|nr:BlaI/MecI/CopY family transcriptional regulator [Verrucomicrobiota bacterium]